MSDEVNVRERGGTDAPPAIEGESAGPRYDVVTSAPEADWLKEADRADADLQHLLGMTEIAVNSVETAQWTVYYCASRVVRYARAHEAEWKDFADQNILGGDGIEAQVGDLLLRRSPDLGDLSDGAARKRRLEHANILTWFADNRIDDPLQVIKEGAEKGRTAINKEVADAKREADRHARTAAATAARKRKREEKLAEEARQKEAEEEDRKRRLAETARQQEEDAKRLRDEKEAALRRALEGQPLSNPPPVTEPVAEPVAESATESEKPEFYHRRTETPAETPPATEGVVTETPPEAAAAEGEVTETPATEAPPEGAVTEGEVNDDTAEEDQEEELTPLNDIAHHLHNLPQTAERWELARAICELIDQEEIAPDHHTKPPLASSLLLQVVDPKTKKASLYRIVDFDLCIDGTVKLVDERRWIAASRKDAA